MTEALTLFDALALMCVGAVLAGALSALSKIRGKREDLIIVAAIGGGAAVFILGFSAFRLFKDATTFWTAAAAIATTVAASVALWVGMEPRRLAESVRRERAMSLAIILSAELQQAYSVYSGVIMALRSFDDEDLVPEATSRWVQFYVTRADLPTLNNLSNDLHVFEAPLSWKLAALSVDHHRTQEAFAPGGVINAVLFTDIKAAELRLVPSGALKSVDECWKLVSSTYGTKLERLAAALAARHIADSIVRRMQPPQMQTM